MMLMRVDLPVPFAPMRPRTSPGRMSRSMPRRTGISAWAFVTPRTVNRSDMLPLLKRVPPLRAVKTPQSPARRTTFAELYEARGVVVSSSRGRCWHSAIPGTVEMGRLSLGSAGNERAGTKHSVIRCRPCLSLPHRLPRTGTGRTSSPRDVPNAASHRFTTRSQRLDYARPYRGGALRSPKPVSYTHLRAHETDSYL